VLRNMQVLRAPQGTNFRVTEEEWEALQTLLDGSTPVEEDYVEPDFNQILSAVLEQGIKVSERSLRRYHLGLKSRGFVILSGVSGGGKTWLTEAYARALGAEYVVVPVAPNWTTNEDLLGYFNPLDNEYHDTRFSRFLRAAAAAYKRAQGEGRTAKPYHLILDEMNLARVEYYFAKFLSAMEVRARYGTATIELGPEEQVLLPPNLRFAGTVNVDETTHGFADKVYDRAQLIELEASREAILEHIGEAPYREVLMEVWDITYPVAPFAFRVLDEITAYVNQAGALGVTWQEALDEQLLQKVLPKLKGTDIRVSETLEWLVALTDGAFPLSHAKVTKMLDEFRQHGFASYF
jgi:5-methylcytosine-specific restriction endonuclease McrBC GTP-binding regulatory subunit McrB